MSSGPYREMPSKRSVGKIVKAWFRAGQYGENVPTHVLDEDGCLYERVGELTKGQERLPSHQQTIVWGWREIDRRILP